MVRFFLVIMGFFVLGWSTVSACGDIRQYLLASSETETRAQCMESLRKEGPDGLLKALSYFDQLEQTLKSNTESERGAKLQEQKQLLTEAIDSIAGQRHATVSRLYWYTDFEEAKKRAAEIKKPILSLRMLGKLNDEFSCANSRFFRTALYANEEISSILRDRFVLHWESVRPVPKVTIDFGDGRKVERTITGNSAHYVLSADGQPLEALPGLYSPQEFIIWLERSEQLAKTFSSLDDQQDRNKYLKDYHSNRMYALRDKWAKDIKQVAPELLKISYFGYQGSRSVIQSQESNEPQVISNAVLGKYLRGTSDLIYIDALEIATLAMGKARPEVPILRAIRESPQKTDRMVTDKLWQRLASIHRPNVKLDKSSVELMRKLNPAAQRAAVRAPSKKLVEAPILRIVRNFEDSIALDTVRNEYLLHRQIHRWFSNEENTSDLTALNERIYTELFLTPSSDPWLGLVPPDAYTALQGRGIHQQTAQERVPR